MIFSGDFFGRFFRVSQGRLRVAGVDVKGFWSGGNWIAPEADLFDADLSGHSLVGAELFGAYLSGADLRGASLPLADLTGAYLSKANLLDANLSHTCLVAADLAEADVSGANLCEAKLDGACLAGVDLRGANLAFSSLRGANLREANLRGANFYRADLTGANLTDANITGANFASAILACSNRDGVVNEDTIWPDEMVRDNAVEDARWALREAWKQVEQKQTEVDEEPEAQAASNTGRKPAPQSLWDLSDCAPLCPASTRSRTGNLFPPGCRRS